MDIGSIKRLLIVKPSSLGDIIHSLPVLNVLNRCLPSAEIDWVVAKGFEGLLENHPMISRLWIIDKDRWKKLGNIKGTVGELKTLTSKLRGRKYDCVIDLQGLLRSGLITKASGAKIRIGFQEAREGGHLFYTHKVQGGRGIHAVDRYLKIPKAMGCDTSAVRFPLPEFPPVSRTDIIFDFDYAVLVPGARKPANRWPAERYGRLASLLPIRSVVVGSRSDRSIADEVVSASGGRALSLAGKTDLTELFQVIRKARFVISNDSGPMHIAAALGVHVFAIFGPADPNRTGPYGDNKTVIRSNIDCAPCFKRHCDNVRCLDEISVEMVLDVISRHSFATVTGNKR